ncbi:hypothetical protein E6C50_00055 [Flavobacterium supellecticarium]|uniref:Lipoprotein n=1 Tax=Flavobacterium supellecticarium TaxID=2565924 RepID=A0A4S4A2L9_9FLAO|nr:hypothetical protein [Flavobacterium supellecticarium]THF52642.1 hypothetical protein E6C50_00055 [Flavobacterium supellecticarium]
MKKITFLAVMLVAFSGGILTSCETESADASLIGNNNTNGGGNTVSGGDYYPLAIGNRWVSESINQNTGEISIDTSKIVDTQMDNGKLYYLGNKKEGEEVVAEIGNRSVDKVRKENNIYYGKMDAFDRPPSGISFGTRFSGTGDIVILKQDLPVTGTWHNDYSYTLTNYHPMLPQDQVITTTVSETHTILQRDQILTVKGHTYQNVIKVKMEQVSRMSMPGLPETENFTATITVYNWYARNIGVIKSEVTMSGESGSESLHSELLSYIVN